MTEAFCAIVIIEFPVLRAFITPSIAPEELGRTSLRDNMSQTKVDAEVWPIGEIGVSLQADLPCSDGEVHTAYLLWASHSLHTNERVRHTAYRHKPHS